MCSMTLHLLANCFYYKVFEDYDMCRFSLTTYLYTAVSFGKVNTKIEVNFKINPKHRLKTKV